MSISDQILAALLLYGLPVLFGVIFVCSVGIPFPISLVLVAAGSFAQQGEMNLWSVIAVASIGAILGDHVAYGLARWGGRRVVGRLSRRIGAEENLQVAERFTKRWSGTGVFLSRWLVTALGPWVNLTSGIARYPWRRFLLWDVLGEVLWVVLYVTLGYVFSDRVQALGEIIGSLSWVMVGLIVALVLGWKLLGFVRSSGLESHQSEN